MSDETRKIDVEIHGAGSCFPIASSRTHIGTKEGVGWTEEFCVKPDTATCDTAGAFEKHLLPAANGALPGLSFKLVGRFP